MATFDDLGKLFSHIKKQVSDTLNNEVKETTVNHLKINIEQEVYDKYEPSRYVRLRDQGGLLDDRNIFQELVSPDTLSVRSIRSDRGKDVANIIETGKGYTWDWTVGTLPPPRPFHYQTFEDLERTLSHVEAMRQGLRRRGIDAL